MRILLVEDDEELARRLKLGLGEAGFAVDHAADGETAVELGETQVFDAVVLDLGLPRLPGLEVLRRWRAKRRNMPVLVLTARDAWTERVDGLNAGADDYLGKPFQTAEVVARLRALVRRSAGDASPILVHEDVRLDVTGGAATLEGRPVDLTARELRILGYLMHRQGRIVSQAELMDHVYALDDIRESNTIEVYVGRLRKKLGKDCIRTIRGLGYRVG
ncbi:DNA-binding response OmpR family regulator [Brevundimonas nasdae]|uniref:Response regulator transcription factor n=1 Tax=Brevundimonas nasdae TaxID=172043 RepID=A0ABX8TLL6_9CAUL|nr:response regulator transcription factor [Brevundimonas nasdae]MBK6025361.1 response regulator transcription factor [Brevundimonas nasdae]MDQ0451855.1 DNA-binding response OmpR family regulator [Brevundimonas nasdae]QYC10019.1 response regulator transcription factor [Brevundimonas nasdae]QYC12809.1 response regulator transcription factor [Brevundimonas nasdae]